MRPRSGAARSVADLLGKPGGLLSSALARAGEEERWRRRLAEKLPEPLVARITGIAQEGGTLTVFTESAAWCARLRYVLPECSAALHAELPELKKIEVKVLPPPAGGKRGRGA